MNIIRRLKYFLIILFILMILYVNIDIYSYKEIKLSKNIDNKNKSKILNINNTNKIINSNINQRYIALLKGKDYINKCLKGFLINNNIFKMSNNTLISAIIPVFNCEKTIRASIRSIQNQNISNIEIILINDFSLDNSLDIIKKLQKEDSRIKIINNNKNMGTLYSRCIGALSAKGKYIFPLDNDDMFLDYDVFDFIYKIGISENFDIVGFKSIYATNYNYSIEKVRDNPFSNHPNNLIIHQPELGKHPLIKNKIYNDIHIWGKCIKNEIYKNGVNLLGKKRYSTFMSWCEDTSMVFIIFNIARSFKFVHKYGVIHLQSYLTASYTQSINSKIFGEIFLLNIIFEFSKNNSDKNLAVYYAFHIKYKYNINKFKNDTNLLNLKFILKKIITCKYINQINREKIIKNFEDFNLLK